MNALTIITTKTPRVTAHDMTAITKAVREGFASVIECKVFARHFAGDDAQMSFARYAYARAMFREEKSLTVAQVAMLAEVSLERVMHYCARLSIGVLDVISTNDASRVMMRIAD